MFVPSTWRPLVVNPIPPPKIHLLYGTKSMRLGWSNFQSKTVGILTYVSRNKAVNRLLEGLYYRANNNEKTIQRPIMFQMLDLPPKTSVLHAGACEDPDDFSVINSAFQGGGILLRLDL